MKERSDVDLMKLDIENEERKELLLTPPFKIKPGCHDICDVYGAEHLLRFCDYIVIEYGRCIKRKRVI